MLNNILKNRKLKYGLVSLLAVVLIGGAVTLAYLSKSTEAATNNFAPGEVTTEIEENPKVEGSTIKKDPAVKNIGPSACIVRMRVTISPGSIADRVNNDEKADEIKIDFNMEDWKYNKEDGFWYYQSIVPFTEPNTATKPLFTEIKGVTDQEGKPLEDFEDFQITLYQEAVQTEVTIDETPVKATNETGNYDHENAMKIWAEFDKKTVNE